MKKLKPTRQYKKDYKRFRNTPKKVEKLFKILELLQNELPIPEENRPHPLTGARNQFLLAFNQQDGGVVGKIFVQNFPQFLHIHIFYFYCHKIRT